MEIVEKVKAVVLRAARNVSGTAEEAPRIENDTTTPEGRALTEHHEKIAAKNGPPKWSKPTLGDLQTQYENIQEQLSYWERVREEASDWAKAAEGKLFNAKELLKLVGDLPKGERALDAKNRAEAAIEKETRWLGIQQKRVANAEAQLKVWAKRANEFPKDEMKRLQREESILSSVPGTVRGGLTPERIRGL